MKTKLLMLLVAIGLLAGCRSDVVEEKVESKTVEKEKVDQQKKEDQQKKVEQEKKAKEKELKEKKAKEELSAYSSTMSKNLEDVSTIYYTIGEASQLVSENPMLFFSEETYKTFDEISKAIYRVDENIRSVKVPDNENVKKAHEYILLTMDDLKVVADELPDAIRNVDADKINSLTVRISQSSDNMKEAQKYMEKVK